MWVNLRFLLLPLLRANDHQRRRRGVQQALEQVASAHKEAARGMASFERVSAQAVQAANVAAEAVSGIASIASRNAADEEPHRRMLCQSGGGSSSISGKQDGHVRQ